MALNCAGLHADRLAGPLAAELRIIPFRGYYAELITARVGLIRSHVYAAPDLMFPFLGVHFSRQADGRVIVGPGAILAFGREAYHFAQVQPRDLAGTLAWPRFWRMMPQPRFRAPVRSEVMKSLVISGSGRSPPARPRAGRGRSSAIFHRLSRAAGEPRGGAGGRHRGAGIGGDGPRAQRPVAGTDVRFSVWGRI